jgi:hypothetical protein
MGRKPKLTDHQQREALQRRDAGEPTREIDRIYNVSRIVRFRDRRRDRYSLASRCDTISAWPGGLARAVDYVARHGALSHSEGGVEKRLHRRLRPIKQV